VVLLHRKHDQLKAAHQVGQSFRFLRFDEKFEQRVQVGNFQNYRMRIKVFCS